ncbi:MAG TPA: hypothetical protein VGM88_21780 [Kofleriaceae bacterium]
MALVLVGGRVAHAQGWDRTGWVKLGEREVNGRVDRDKIEVGAYEGRFSKLTLACEHSDMELLDFEVTFGNGEHWNAGVRHYFKEGSRTRVIDLPGDNRVIKSISLKYRNIPGGGRAMVEVWGLKDAGPRPPVGGPPAPPARPWAFESRGWTMLGEREVNGHGREDHDTISVGRAEGKFRKMTIVVLDGDLELIDMAVKFARGPEWRPAVAQTFREGTRTRVIDFPGDERAIKFIDFRYRNLSGGAHAKVQVWAQ